LQHVWRNAGLMQQAHGFGAISGVCSAGLASTTLPAPRAAATWPVKMASGKFQGLMQTTGPSGGEQIRIGLPPNLSRVIAQKVHGLAHLGHGIGAVLPASRISRLISGCICVSKSSAAVCSRLARSSAGLACQAG
jgi:hypothetical protein